MAVDYADLFDDLGQLVHYWDVWDALGEDLDLVLDEILDEFDDTDQDAAADGLIGDFEGWKGEYVGRRSAMVSRTLDRLQDRDSVLLEIGAVTDSQDEILTKLVRQMRTDSATVKANVVTIGTVTAIGTATTANKGTVLIFGVLDGVSSPGAGMLAMDDYRARTSELARAETITITCTSDSFVDRVTEGSESFQVDGDNPDPNGQFGVDEEGSGSLGGFQAIHAETSRYVLNADFEDFTTANTPDNWTISSGTVTTHVQEETSQVYHGDSSLALIGDGAQATILLYQLVDPSRVDANRAYIVTVRLKANAAGHTGNFNLVFSGTGYTAGSTEEIFIAANTIDNAAWELQSFLVVMPRELPSDLKLVLSWSGTPGAGDELYIDDIGMAPANYFGGLAFAAVRGSVPFYRHDRWTSAITNDEGAFQGFFRRAFGVQLPSKTDATETISDSQAT